MDIIMWLIIFILSAIAWLYLRSEQKQMSNNARDKTSNASINDSEEQKVHVGNLINSLFLLVVTVVLGYLCYYLYPSGIFNTPFSALTLLVVFKLLGSVIVGISCIVSAIILLIK